MREALNKVAAALFVTMLLMRQFPVPSLAYATEGTPAESQYSAADNAAGPEQSVGTAPASEDGNEADGKVQPGDQQAGQAEPEERDPRRAEPYSARSAKAPARSPSTSDGTAYAVYDKTSRTLTLVRSNDTIEDGPGQTVTDICGNTWSGTVFGGIEDLVATSAEDVPWHAEAADFYHGVRTFQVAEGCVIHPSSCAWWLCDARSLGTVSLGGLDTSGTISFAHLFDGCDSLQTIDASPLDTSSATSMAAMFKECRYLSDLTLSGLDTSGVADMSSMFEGCEHIPALDLSGFDTGSVTSMAHMFARCKAMTTLDITGWDTSGVADMSSMFGGCNALTRIPTEELDTSACTSMTGMFGGCWIVGSLDLSGFDTSNVADMSNMFTSCHALTGLDLSSFDTSSVTDLTYMFQTCNHLQSIDLSSFDTRGAAAADAMFQGCSVLREVKLGEDFRFLPGDTGHNYLPSPPSNDTYTGYWVNSDDETQFLNESWLSIRYDGETMAGTWVWEEWHDCPLTMDLDGGSAPVGTQYPTSYRIGTGIALPGTTESELAAPTKRGCTFLYWVDEDGNRVETVDANSRGPRTVTAKWRASQIRVRVPVAVTLTASQQRDGSLSLAADGGDFSLSVDNLCPYTITAVATAEHADGFAIADPDETPGDREAEVWLTPVTTGSDPTAEGYDPASDEGYEEHGQIALSGLGNDTQVGPDMDPYGRLWLNKVGGTMGGWSTNDGSKALLAQIHWTFSLASEG